MPIKCTALFQLSTNVDFPNLPAHRIGGWSESWYYIGSSIPNAIQAFASPGTALFPFSWCAGRAALLPGGAAIIGQRYQQVAPVGQSQTAGGIYPGSAGEAADIPQQALLCSIPAVGAGNIKRFTLRGIPDARIIEGEFQGTQSFTQSLNNFFFVLGNFQFRARDLTQPTANIVSISAAGLVTCEAAATFNVNDMVRVLRTRTVDGDLLGGRFQVASVGPGNNVFTLANWSPAEATTGGRVRRDSIVFLPADNTRAAAYRAVIRKVGRPFGAYRGRRSAKRA